jgi:hypothetical protein
MSKTGVITTISWLESSASYRRDPDLNFKIIIKLASDIFEAPYYVTFFIILFTVINEVIILSLCVS